ncbi:MAG: LysM peptidoglycan-binding domain-containing protein [Candidatus Deferrimicrobiaceae bacterium]
MIRYAAGFLAVLLLASGSRGEEAERPRIYLEKKIFEETSKGRKTFYEVHTISQGETLWKILSEKSPLFPEDYSSLLREFLRANPDVKDPGKLVPGQRILIPAALGMKTARLVETGKTVAYQVRRGDSLSGILAARGVPRGNLSRYLSTVKELNDSIRDVNVIMAGKTILLPTGEYFEKKPVAVAEKAPDVPAPVVVPSPAPVEETPAPAASAVAQRQDLAPAPEEHPAAKPESRVAEPAPAPPAVEETPAPAASALALTQEVGPQPEAQPTAKPESRVAEPAPAPPVSRERPAPAVALTREVAPEPGGEALQAARPESRVAVPASPAPEPPAVVIGPKAKEPAPPPLPQPKPPYRGLLADLTRGLGEKWVDRGTLYLPIPSGGEVVLNLEDYPVVRFFGGIHALIDFRGALPAEVRRLITETWKNYRVVRMDAASGAEDMVDRLLGASGYYSVKEGIAHPPVIGESVSVTLPARWVVLRTSQSLLNGEIILIKKVAEKPASELTAVLRYADRVGIRVLPFSFDPSANEGFLAGWEPAKKAVEEAPRSSLPQKGLEALDFSLDLLGIPKTEGKRIRIGGGVDSFLLTIQPERIFEAGGKRFLVDTGNMSPALRTIIQNSGYSVFLAGKGETGRSILQRLLTDAKIPVEERKEYLLAGGEGKDFEVRATGTFFTSREWLAGRKAREVVLVRGKVHSATRDLAKEIGVEIVEW